MFRAIFCPKHVELILEINKLLLLHLVGSSILLYLKALLPVYFGCISGNPSLLSQPRNCIYSLFVSRNFCFHPLPMQCTYYEYLFLSGKLSVPLSARGCIFYIPFTVWNMTVVEEQISIESTAFWNRTKINNVGEVDP